MTPVNMLVYARMAEADAAMLPRVLRIDGKPRIVRLERVFWDVADERGFSYETLPNEPGHVLASRIRAWCMTLYLRHATRH